MTAIRVKASRRPVAPSLSQDAERKLRSWSARRLVVAAIALCGVVLPAAGARADNPIVQTNFTSDPAPMVSNGRVYLITTHDENAAGQPCSAVAGYTLCQWFAYSSADMVNWTDHGVVASWKSFSWASTAAWAPQAIPRNGKFYIYVPLNNTSGATNIGVGVSTSPTGPYMDAIGKPLVTAGCPGGSGDIDPTVFIDDDEQAYLYFGRSVPGYVKLNSDMTSYTGGVQCPAVNAQSFGPASAGGFPSQYEEGPWIMKHGTTYYLAYAANNIPEDISYSKASAPTGPFTYGGTIMKAMGASFTNHSGIIDFNGHSYFFYHNGALQKGGSVPSNGDGYHRSVCLEEFKYNTDGSIPTIPPTTAGPQPLANLNPFLQTEAETIAWESGVQTEVSSDTGGGMDVTSINNGDYIKVKSVDFGTGATSFDARVAASSGGGSIELHLESVSGTMIGACPVAATGGAQTWATQTCTVTSTTGVHDLFLKFTGSGSGNLFTFNWWKFGGPGASSTGGGGMGGATTTGSGGAGGAKGSGGAGAAGGSGASSTGGSAAGGHVGTGGTVGATGGTTGAGSGGTPGSGGAVATGGTKGSGGATASGGTQGSGGTVATGGVTGSGGSGTSGSGGASAGSGGTDGNGSGGCSCEMASGRSGGTFGILTLLLASIWTRRRPRRPRGMR